MDNMAVGAGKDARPWYREPWPWILFGLPGIVVAASFITLWLAVRSDDGVVAADYYKQGLSINAELSRARRAADLALVADVEFTGLASGDRVRVRLSAEGNLPPEAALRLKLIHPGHGGADRTVILSRSSSEGNRAEYVGQFSADAVNSQSVAWLVSLETQTWRLDGQMKLKDGNLLRMTAARN
jgi:uncharacterized protein